MTRARDLASTALNSTVNTTELGYLDGVTSSVQTQLNGKKAETNSAISANQTLVSGYRYFVDTAAARTLTLPASPSVGDEIQVFDSTNTAATNKITLGSNSLKINGTVQDAELDVNGVAVALVYTGSTYGWRLG
jgi:hypothetical protein